MYTISEIQSRRDVKYINIPNICFSITSKDDSREESFSIQRKIYGFDDSETWSLTDTLCNFILPRLKRFREINNGFPYGLTFSSWCDIIDKIILSLELISRDSGSQVWNKEEQSQITEGLDLFREYFLSLWW